MLVSFIIPCFNASRWVIRCFDSIYDLGLHEEEFEVIAVDDASTDGTLGVLEEYAASHTNLQILRHLVNRNVGAARNTGLAVARGQYITFVDSDDEVGPGIASAIEMASARDLDMVVLGIQSVSENGIILKEKSLSELEGRVFSGVEFQSMHPYWHAGVHGYVFSSKLLSSIRYYFVEGAYYEDVDYLCHHLLKANRMSYCDECGYRYYSNSESITHNITPKHVFGYTYLGVRMLDFYESIQDKSGAFAFSILEGGSFNIMYGIKILLRLQSFSDIRGFYNQLDSKADRKSLIKILKHAPNWRWQTRFGLRHRHLTTIAVGIFVSMGAYKVAKRMFGKKAK